MKNSDGPVIILLLIKEADGGKRRIFGPHVKKIGGTEKPPPAGLVLRHISKSAKR